MKKIFCIVTLSLLVCAGASLGDSLAVTAAAAMGGSGTNCSGGPCGLEVFHDNTSRAFVRDDSPESESVYRANFLFNPNSMSQEVGSFRHIIMSGLGENPNPSNGACPASSGQVNIIRLWLRLEGPNGELYRLQAEGRGNLCGKRTTSKFDLAKDQPVRICMEWATGGSSTGFIALAVVDVANACPTSGDPAYGRVDFSNQRTVLDQVRLGAPSTNNFNVVQNGTYYMDEFESFRTLAP